MRKMEDKGTGSRDRWEKRQKEQWADMLFFCVLLLIVSAVTLVLFNRQTHGNPDSYHSDMKAYILEMQGLDSGYSFPYPIFFKLSAFLHLFLEAEFAVALATMLLNSLGIVVVKAMLQKLLGEQLARCLRSRIRAGVLISLVSVSLFFISMLFPPKGIYLPGIKYNYLGVFTSNPFHNATYMAARPFAVLAFFLFARLLDEYEEGLRGKGESGGVPLYDYVLFSLFLLLATMTKPSFTIVLVGAAGLIMLWRMFRSRFRNFVPTLQLGLCFIPTFIDLLYQFRGVFVPEEGAEGGIGFSLGEVWTQYCSNIPLAVCLAVGFPLLVLLLNHRQLRENTLFRFSWQVYGMSFLMAFFLYEKGFRKYDFNFSWGYMYGIFFCFVGALAVLLQVTAQQAGTDGKKRGRGAKALLALQWLAYLAHLACGLYYFFTIFMGKMYY